MFSTSTMRQIASLRVIFLKNVWGLPPSPLTPRAVAYACIQVIQSQFSSIDYSRPFLKPNHCLNSQNDWSKVDGAFSTEKLFWTRVNR